MKKLLRAFWLMLGMGASLMAAPVSPPAGNYITNISTNPNIQVLKVSSGTFQNITINGTCTGPGCGTGGGGGSTNGTIVASPQFQIPYYSLSGATTTVTGSPDITVQTGIGVIVDTMTVSSMTITGSETIGGSGFPNSASVVYTGSGFTGYTAPTPSVSPIATLLMTNTSINGSPIGVNFDDSNGAWFAGFGKTFSKIRSNTTISSSTILTGEVLISSGVQLSGSEGTNGQVFTSGGPGTSPTWTTVSGGGVTVYPASATASFPFGLSVSTIAVNSSGDASIVGTIGGTSYSTTWSSTTAINTVGQCAVFSGTNTVIGQTCSSGGGTPGTPLNSIQYNSAGSFAGTPLATVDVSSISFNNISSMTFVGFSTFDASGQGDSVLAYSLVVGSTTDISRGINPYAIINSSGSSQAVSVVSNGEGGGILQDVNSGAVNIKRINWNAW